MAVREGLLALLADGARYGYQLKTEFESATGGVWDLNVGQVYSTLDRLVRDGLVAVDERDDQKSYELTRAGEAELEDWWTSTPGDGPPARDELLLKILLATAHGPDHALDVVTRHRTALTAVLQARRRAGRGRDGDVDLATRLVDDALLTRTEAELRWLDQCERRIVDARTLANGGSTA